MDEETHAETTRGQVNRLVEKLGRAFEGTSGMPRVAGRLLALLLVEEGPFSFDELAGRLKVSRASISTNTRLLEERGAIERTSRLGDRRDFFRLAPHPFSRMLEESLERMDHLARVAAEGRQSLPPSMSYARERLNGTVRAHRAAIQALETLRQTFEEEFDAETQA